MLTSTCPQCHRTINTRVNRFGDECFRYHKMATIRDLEKLDSELKQDYRVGYDESRYPLWQIDCPMSGMPVERKME
jgi:hypothetical protein